jgi:hypothetical protein
MQTGLRVKWQSSVNTAINLWEKSSIFLLASQEGLVHEIHCVQILGVHVLLSCNFLVMMKQFLENKTLKRVCIKGDYVVGDEKYDSSQGSHKKKLIQIMIYPSESLGVWTLSITK